jgi:hypothetical protein
MWQCTCTRLRERLPFSPPLSVRGSLTAFFKNTKCQPFTALQWKTVNSKTMNTTYATSIPPPIHPVDLPYHTVIVKTKVDNHSVPNSAMFTLPCSNVPPVSSMTILRHRVSRMMLLPAVFATKIPE